MCHARADCDGLVSREQDGTNEIRDLIRRFHINCLTCLEELFGVGDPRITEVLELFRAVLELTEFTHTERADQFQLGTGSDGAELRCPTHGQEGQVPWDELHPRTDTRRTSRRRSTLAIEKLD